MNFVRLLLKEFVLSTSLYSIGSLLKSFFPRYMGFFYKFKPMCGVHIENFLYVWYCRIKSFLASMAVKTIVGGKFAVVWLSSLLGNWGTAQLPSSNCWYILSTLGIIVAVIVIKKWFGEIDNHGLFAVLMLPYNKSSFNMILLWFYLEMILFNLKICFRTKLFSVKDDLNYLCIHCCNCVNSCNEHQNCAIS